ncbi:MAG: ABC transporter ATP-binding protein [Acidobacteriota bacterium]
MIAFRALRKVFGRHVAVDDLTLRVEAGEVVALLGPNGSGKTTSLKAAAGLVHPTSGAIEIGSPGRPATEAEARSVLSFLPQRASFPDALTGHEILDFYRKLRRAPEGRVRDVLRFASLNGASDRAVATYSGGMIQRLGLAVALLPDAPVLLLDEPTAALDPDGLTAFYEVAERHAREGRTILFTSHQLGDVGRLADRFAVLVQGRLVRVLTQRELHDRLSATGVMRLRLRQCPAALLEAVRRHEPAADWVGDELVVPGPASKRPGVLSLVHGLDVEVCGITTEEGRLDTFYTALVAEAEGRGHAS